MRRFTDLNFEYTPPPPSEYLVGPVEAAKFLQREIELVFCWAELGLIPALQRRYDGHAAWRFRISELAAWVEQSKRDGGPKGFRQLTASTRKALGLRGKAASARRKRAKL
jgi:hypothetical protein